MFLSQKKLFQKKEKKAQPPKDQGWAIVILKPLRTEIRGDLIHRISEAFSISADEAENVVSNTPNILLDELKQATAVKVKDFFRATGAEMFLTNDTFVKSKCYRTVWPEKPDLTNVLGAEEEAPKQVMSEAPKELLKSEEEIIAKLSKAAKSQAKPAEEKTEQPAEAPEPPKPAAEKSMRSRKKPAVDPEQLKESLNEEAESLLDSTSEDEMPMSTEHETPIEKEESFKSRFAPKEEPEIEEKPEVASAPETPVEQRGGLSRLTDEESQQVLKYFTQWKENYDAWKDNFVALTGEVEKLRSERESLGDSISESRTKIQNGIKEIQLQKSLLADLEEKRKSSEGNFEKIRQEFNEKLGGISKEIYTWKRKSEEIQQKIASLEEEKSSFESEFDKQEDAYKELQQEYDHARDNFELKLNLSVEVLNQWKNKVAEMNDQMSNIDQVREKVELQLLKQRKEYEQLEQDYQKTKRFAGKKVMIPEEDYEKWKTKEENMTARLEKLEKLQMKLLGDLQDKLSSEEDRKAPSNKKK